MTTYHECDNKKEEGAENPLDSVELIEKKKSPLQALIQKVIMFGGIGIVAFVVIILIIFMFLGRSSKDKYSLYLKDGEIFYTDYSKKGTLKITSRLTNGDDISDSELSDLSYTLGYYITFTDDGSRIFFPDRIDDINDGITNGFTLYYRDVNKPNEEAVEIDSDVIKYAINSDGTKVVYVKGSDRTLYLNNLTDKEKISSRVTSIEYASSDLSTIYYIKDGCLYKQLEGSEDKTKITSNISNVISVYDSGEVYYTKAEVVEKNLWDYVDDDMASSDTALTVPEYPDYPDSPDYPSWWNYENDEEYEAAKAQYETAYEDYEAIREQITADYNAACDVYWEKLDRDDLREELQNATMEIKEYTLYYFNGTEETIITDALVNEWVRYADDKPVMIFQVYNQFDVPKVKLSEISSVDWASWLVESSLYSSSEWCVAVGSVLSIIEQDYSTSFYISSDGSTIYFVNSEDKELYKVAITDEQVGKPELFDSDVSWVSLIFDDNIAYYKNTYIVYSGDLYVNGEEIDYDVRLSDLYSTNISFKDGRVLYYTDWNSAKSYGTLKAFKNGKKTKIADDVHDFDITSDGDILYLYDYSTNYYTGILYLYNNGEPKKVDDEVVALIPIYDDTIMR
ncbi:MAG: hypothetical protein Q4D90_07165 [bacterium]|nr:hypothetical protein [bacterium]